MATVGERRTRVAEPQLVARTDLTECNSGRLLSVSTYETPDHGLETMVFHVSSITGRRNGEYEGMAAVLHTSHAAARLHHVATVARLLTGDAIA